MTNKTDCRRDCALSEGYRAEMLPEQELMPVWRASVRMALVTAASLLAAGLIVTSLGACADLSGIAPTASLRDAPEVTAPTRNTTKLIAGYARVVSVNGTFDR